MPDVLRGGPAPPSVAEALEMTEVESSPPSERTDSRASAASGGACDPPSDRPCLRGSQWPSPGRRARPSVAASRTGMRIAKSRVVHPSKLGVNDA